MPRPRWHSFLVGLAAAALLLVVVAPVTASQSDTRPSEAREVAQLPDDFWAPAPPSSGETSGTGSPADGGWSTTVVMVAVLGAYLLGFMANYAAGLLPAGGAAPAWPDPVPPPEDEAACAIELEHERFAVVIGGRVVARSERFDVPREGPLRLEGEASDVHGRLVRRLRAVGWELAPAEGAAWYESRFIRTQSAAGRVALVELRNGPGQAWFSAVALNEHAGATPLGESPAFSVQGARDPERSVTAAVAHAALLTDLEAAGWEAGGVLGPWYATTLGSRAIAPV